MYDKPIALLNVMGARQRVREATVEYEEALERCAVLGCGVRQTARRAEVAPSSITNHPAWKRGLASRVAGV